MIRSVRGLVLLAVLANPILAVAEPSPSPPTVTLEIAGVASDAEKTRLQQWIDESVVVISSAKFKANLRSLSSKHPKIFISLSQPEGSIEQLIGIIEGKGAYRYFRMPVGLFASESYSDSIAYNARTGPIDWQGVGDEFAMSIGRVNIYRYKQTDIVDRSCAINTLVHETVHTISRDSNKFLFAVEDTLSSARPNPSLALASYLVGSAAQCTYLQNAGRVGPTGFSACVEVFGTKAFNNLRCTEFGQGQTVEFRAGLPPPANEL